jgi:hypothetical protein
LLLYRHSFAISTTIFTLLDMAPKRGLQETAERVKISSTPASRSATPAENTDRITFSVRYPPPPHKKRKLTKKEQDLVDYAKLQVSPFVAKGASKKRELDQYYTIVPSPEWEAMKKYNNFISRWRYGPYRVR